MSAQADARLVWVTREERDEADSELLPEVLRPHVKIRVPITRFDAAPAPLEITLYQCPECGGMALHEDDNCATIECGAERLAIKHYAVPATPTRQPEGDT